jgi:hypothetical protein
LRVCKALQSSALPWKKRCDDIWRAGHEKSCSSTKEGTANRHGLGAQAPLPTVLVI